MPAHALFHAHSKPSIDGHPSIIETLQRAAPSNCPLILVRREVSDRPDQRHPLSRYRIVTGPMPSNVGWADTSRARDVMACSAFHRGHRRTRRRTPSLKRLTNVR